MMMIIAEHHEQACYFLKNSNTQRPNTANALQATDRKSVV